MRRNISTHIQISNHAVERFYERFQFAGAEGSSEKEKEDHAKRIIREMFEEAFYLRDEKGSVYFRAEDYRANLIVRGGIIVTIMHDKLKCKNKKKCRKAS